MKKVIQTTGIIRDRGQLTIPNKIRDIFHWITTNSVVSIRTTINEEMVIKPYEKEKEVDWDKIWKNLKKLRSFKGKSKKPLSKFIAEDRYRH